MKAAGIVILAGGVSSRMREAVAVSEVEERLLREADERPKGMLGVGPGGRPFLDYLLYNVRSAGITDVVIVVGEQDRSVRERYGQKDRGNEFHGLRISYAVQRIPEGRTKPLGTADAVLTAMRIKEEWRGRSFVVCNSDNLYSTTALRAMHHTDALGALIEYDREGLGLDRARVDTYATVVTGADGFVKEIVEKPSTEVLSRILKDHPTSGVSMNIYRLPFDLIEPILESMPMHPERGEKELPTAVGMLVRKDPTCLVAVRRTEPVPDLTRRTDIAAVQKSLRETFGEFDWN
jgi:glucose-1-phosphate adenylyltransferase